MAYNVQILPSAACELAALPAKFRERMNARIRSLASDPRPFGTVKLHGSPALYRSRVGDYRIVYEIRDQILVVLVVKVAHRREVYR
jgi:mRNA interferase RelE/StbE